MGVRPATHGTRARNRYAKMSGPIGGRQSAPPITWRTPNESGRPRARAESEGDKRGIHNDGVLPHDGACDAVRLRRLGVGVDRVVIPLRELFTAPLA